MADEDYGDYYELSDEDDSKPCPKCHGRGCAIDGFPCEYCDGEGTLLL